MARRVSIERAIEAVQAVEQLQATLHEVLRVLKNLSERIVALEAGERKSPQP